MKEYITIEEYLEDETAYYKQYPIIKDGVYCCTEHFVLCHGQQFNPKPFENKYRPAQRPAVDNRCFVNAYDLSSENSETLRYVEGFALPVGHKYPLMHAWCADRDDNVIDPTWKIGDGYYGIAFSLRYLCMTLCQKECGSVLDNWEMDHPLLYGIDTDWATR